MHIFITKHYVNLYNNKKTTQKWFSLYCIPARYGYLAPLSIMQYFTIGQQFLNFFSLAQRDVGTRKVKIFELG